jgi:hypothetical protein
MTLLIVNVSRRMRQRLPVRNAPEIAVAAAPCWSQLRTENRFPLFLELL